MIEKHDIEEEGFDFNGLTAHIANFLKNLLTLFDEIKAFFDSLSSDDGE